MWGSGFKFLGVGLQGLVAVLGLRRFRPWVC